MNKLLITAISLVISNVAWAWEPILPEPEPQNKQYKLAIKTIAQAYYKGSPLEQQTRRTFKKYKAEFIAKEYEPQYIVGLMIVQSLIEGKIKVQYRWEF